MNFAGEVDGWWLQRLLVNVLQHWQWIRVVAVSQSGLNFLPRLDQTLGKHLIKPFMIS
jgi:hypothetical protein